MVFDFDGVIVDSKANVMEAYSRVGITMPEEAWGKPWVDWLPDLVGSKTNAAIMHEKKNEYLAEMTPKFNPAFAVFAECTRRYPHNTFILTGASMGAVTSTAPWASAYAMAGRSLDLKITTLNILGERGPVLYIDDMPEAVDRVRKDTAVDVILYDPSVDLETRITEWRKKWTL